MTYGNNLTFQQDDAPAHLHDKQLRFLRLHVPELVEPENWPPNSPDLNPVDYSIWEALQQLVYRCRRIRDVEYLKEVLQTCWEQIGQDVIDRAIRQFHKRLSLIVATDGGHNSTSLTTVLGATCTLSYLRVLMQKYRTWTTKVNSAVYSAPPCIK